MFNVERENRHNVAAAAAAVTNSYSSSCVRRDFFRAVFGLRARRASLASSPRRYITSGASIKYVRKMLGFFDHLPPRTYYKIHATVLSLDFPPPYGAYILLHFTLLRLQAARHVFILKPIVPCFLDLPKVSSSQPLQPPHRKVAPTPACPRHPGNRVSSFLPLLSSEQSRISSRQWCFCGSVNLSGGPHPSHSLARFLAPRFLGRCKIRRPAQLLLCGGGVRVRR